MFSCCPAWQVLLFIVKQLIVISVNHSFMGQSLQVTVLGCLTCFFGLVILSVDTQTFEANGSVTSVRDLQVGATVNYQATKKANDSMYPNVSRAIRMLDTSLLEPRRMKRTTWKSTTKNWPHDIPYVLHPSYPIGNVPELKRAMAYISSRVCVNFHDVTGVYVKSDKRWFTQNGFKVNSYLLVRDSGSCVATVGQGDRPGARYVSPCKGFINLHEMLHTLGSLHAQSGKNRDQYMTVNFQNIQENLRSSYMKQDSPDILSVYFDPISTLMYHNKTWSVNGQDTYTPIRDDFFHLASRFSHEHPVFLELNQVYKCAEIFCKETKKDCKPGYLAKVNSVCRCVCPDNLDPGQNCKALVNGSNRYTMWPKVPMTILGVDDKCPAGFQKGWLPITGQSPPWQNSTPVSAFPSSGNRLEIPLCTKAYSRNFHQIDWTSFPVGGHYCFIKAKGIGCSKYFSEGMFVFETSVTNHPNGSVGDIDVDGDIMTLHFCCSESEHWLLAMDLPDAEPFRLLGRRTCPIVRGMNRIRSNVKLYLKNFWVFGATPHYEISANSFQTVQCLYIPPIYGCNKVTTLNRYVKFARFTTPGFGAGRETNRRCFYAFNVPKNSRLKLTLNTFDLHDNDDFLIKRYHQWQDPYRVVNSNLERQFISAGDYLGLEYYSSWQNSWKNGLDFTVHLILPEELCYDLKSRGEDYMGDKSVTENYEECLPWSKATACSDFPFNGLNSFVLLTSGNRCRNPNVSLAQPWCYTYINGSTCHKRYCDVCNFKSTFDVLGNCESLIARNPEFCRTSPSRFNCFKSCSLDRQSYERGTCKTPVVPPDAVPLKLSLGKKYRLGTTLNITCKYFTSLVSQITCTQDGWTSLHTACHESFCRDRTDMCGDVLAVFPDFCTNSRSSETALSYCKKSCGRCYGNKHN